MRSDKDEIIFRATIGSHSANLPDPGPDKQSFKMHLFWEIAVGRDVTTDQLALNIYLRNRKRWWNIWKPSEVAFRGIPRQGNDTAYYRERIRESEFQPRTDDAVFEFVGPSELEVSRFELVLLTIVPKKRLVAGISASGWEDVIGRAGTYRPL